VKRIFTGGFWCSLAMMAICFGSATCGQEPAKPAAEKTPDGLHRLSKTHDVWLDTKRKAVVMDGKICIESGVLEMLACPKGTKEHESIVAVNCLPEEVHAGLLALGAKQGTTVKYEPKFQPATGEIIDIYLIWKTADGTSKEVRAQDVIRHAKDGTPMKHDWVFAGSGFYKDDATGKLLYQANGGDFICVSNFPTATLDLPFDSTQANTGLLFEVKPGSLPPKGTPVRMVLVPRLKKDDKPKEDKSADAPAKDEGK
jgi:hypothetical protein